MSIVTYNNRSIANISAVPGAAKSLTLIKTLTASSSGTLSFLNGSDDVVFDSTYPIYKFVFTSIHLATNGQYLSFQADTGTNTSYNQTITSALFKAYHKEDGGSTYALGYDTGSDQAQATGFQRLSSDLISDNDASISGSLMIFNPSSSTFVKHFMSEANTMVDGSPPYSEVRYYAGYFNTTTALTRVQFKSTSGNIDSGTIKLYGLKDS
jgi:hypothetical protein